MNPFNVSSISQEIKMRNGKLRYVIYAGAALALFSVWVTCSARREAGAAREEQQNALRENFKVFVKPLTTKIDSLGRQGDSLKRVVKKMQVELDLYLTPVKPESPPTRWDTTTIFEQKTSGDKK